MSPEGIGGPGVDGGPGLVAGGGISDAHRGLLSWQDLLAEVTETLRAAAVDVPAAEARWLIEEVSGLEGSDWWVERNQPATVRAVARIDALVARRLRGEPLQYVLGRWAFRSLDLAVDPRVLIPRPETESVVEVALGELDRLHSGPGRGRESPEPLVVVDLGTGSGAMGLAVAVERRWVSVWLTDASAAALEVARANLAGVGRAATRVQVAAGSWFEALPAELVGSVDLIMANPPYVAESDPLPDGVARWEPPEALVSGPSGTEALEVIITGARGWLADRGALVVELAPGQAEAMAGCAREAGFAEVRLEPDLAGRPRALVARR